MKPQDKNDLSAFFEPGSVAIFGSLKETSRQLEARGLPTYIDIETAVKALGVAAGYVGRVKP